ncbi:MAG: hypothetical protein WD534_00235 [Phycisphaeraceae bacterium]
MVTPRHPLIAAPGSLGTWLTVTGLVLLAIHVVMPTISPHFAYGALRVLDRPIGLLVALMMPASDAASNASRLAVTKHSHQKLAEVGS